MTNDLSLRELAFPEADERGLVPRAWAEALLGAVGEPTQTGTQCSKVRKPALDGERSRGGKVSAKAAGEQPALALVEDGNPSPLAMSGDDFYRIACDEAHRRLNVPSATNWAWTTSRWSALASPSMLSMLTFLSPRLIEPTYVRQVHRQWTCRSSQPMTQANRRREDGASAPAVLVGIDPA
jgi:hypothetical protein